MAFEGHRTDLSDPVTPREGPALVAVVAADALLGPLLRPERQLLVVCLKNITYRMIDALGTYS